MPYGKIICLLLVLALPALKGVAQGPVHKMEAMEHQLQQWVASKPDTVITITTHTIAAAAQVGDTMAMLDAVILQSKALINLSRYNDAQLLLKNSLATAENQNLLNTLIGGKLMAQYAKALMLLEQADEATSYYLKALPIFEKHASSVDRGNFYLDLAEFNRIRGNRGELMRYLGKAFEEAKAAGDDALYARYYNRLAETYTSQIKMDSSIHYSTIAIDYARKAGDKNNEAWSLNEIGFAIENTDASQPNPYYAQAAAIFKEVGNIEGYVHAMLNDARALMIKKRFAETKELLDSCMRILEGAPYPRVRIGLYQYLYYYYHRTGQLDSALYYQELYAEAENQQIVHFLNEKIAFQESKFDNVAKQQIINQKELELKTQQLDALRQTRLRNAIAAIVVFLLLVVAFMWIIAKRLRSSNAQLKKATQEVKEANAKLYSSLKQREVLLSEIHHRVKNNLQVVVSLLELQAEKYADETPVLETVTRVRSMGLVHDMIHQQEDVSQLHMQQYVEQLYDEIAIMHAKDKTAKAYIDCGSVTLKLEQAVPVGIMLNELITNSWKHAYSRGKLLEIDISLTITAGICTLEYSDNGLGLPEHIDFEDERNIGLYLLRSMCMQLDGKIKHVSMNGNNIIINFPVDYAAGEDFDSGG